MPNEVKLLPCPFCGGPVELEQTIDGRKWWGVVCRNTMGRGGTCAIQQRPSGSKEAAVERWNTRPTTVVTDEVVERGWTGEAARLSLDAADRPPVRRSTLGGGIQHAAWMLTEIEDGRITGNKAHRWLGYAQGLLVENGYLTLEEAKDANKIASEAAKALASMPTVVTGEQPQSAFNVLVDLHDALVMTREHNPHTHVISFVDHAAEFDRATKFLRAAQPGDA